MISNLTGAGVSEDFLLRRGESASYAVSGTYVGVITLERAVGSSAWSSVAAVTSGAMSAPLDTPQTGDRRTRYRFRATLDGATPWSGTAVCAISTLQLPEVTTISSSATPLINTDLCDAVSITALAVAITSMTSGLSGTPVNFQKLLIRFKDDGTGRAIAWGAKFEARGEALPTTTVASKVTTVGLIYDTGSAKWGCVAVAQEA